MPTMPVSVGVSGPCPQRLHPQYGRRHNAILQCLVTAIPKEGQDVFVEQSISPDNLRPDIVLRDQATGNAVVVDVTIPYEAGPDAFQKARAEKEQKYPGLREWMKAQDNYNTVEVHAFMT